MIAFSATTDLAQANFEIFVVNTDGTNLRRLTQDSPYGCTRPIWSPNGNHLLFRSTSARQNLHLPAESYVMDADGANLRRLTEHITYDEIRFASWLPDGRIGLRFRDGWYDYAIRVDGSDWQRMERHALEYAVEAFSPDHTRALLVKKSLEHHVFYVSDVHGADVQRMPDDQLPRRDLAWSPDAQQIAFVLAEGSYQVPLCVIDADWGNMRHLGKTVVEAQYAWSPDSRRIAFVGLHDGRFAIYIAEADGSNTRFLTDLNEGDYQGELSTQAPAWSPDGTQLVYSMALKDGFHIYCIDVESGQRQLLIGSDPTFDLAYDLAWGP